MLWVYGVDVTRDDFDVIHMTTVDGFVEQRSA